MSARAQEQIDSSNAEFWDELCGTRLAQSVGINDASPESLARYDAAYLDFYPYLERYMPAPDEEGRVLEVGLGYGTVGQRLAASRLEYHGVDIAEGPVRMMRHRLGHLGVADAEARVRVASVLDLPHDSGFFDRFYSIGCLHHTGDIPGSVSEAHRVLRPGGTAVVMLYAKHSYRQAGLALKSLPGRLRRGGHDHDEWLRWRWDHNLAGEAAPFTEYSSTAEVGRMFGDFSSVEIRRENFDSSRVLWRFYIPRERLLGLPARLAGRDLYVTAVK